MIDLLKLPDDLGAYAEARVLARVARASVGGGSGHVLFAFADELCALLAEALQATDAVGGLRLLRDAERIIDRLRGELWRLLCARCVPASGFDDLMRAAARCRREIELLAARSRHRAWIRLQQGRGPTP